MEVRCSCQAGAGNASVLHYVYVYGHGGNQGAVILMYAVDPVVLCAVNAFYMCSINLADPSTRAKQY